MIESLWKRSRWLSLNLKLNHDLKDNIFIQGTSQIGIYQTNSERLPGERRFICTMGYKGALNMLAMIDERFKKMQDQYLCKEYMETHPGLLNQIQNPDGVKYYSNFDMKWLEELAYDLSYNKMTGKNDKE